MQGVMLVPTLLQVGLHTSTLALDAHAPKEAVAIPQSLQHMKSMHALAGHSDQQFVRYLLNSMQSGFQIGLDYKSAKCTPVRGNMLSTVDHPPQYLEELHEGKITEITPILNAFFLDN